MKVFVAGGTGAVGRQLLPQLVQAGHAVVAITRDPGKAPAIAASGAIPVVCDVYDTAALQSAVRDAAPDAIIHQLTDLPPALDPGKLADIYGRNNRVRREGTRHLLGAAAAAGVPRMIVQSMGTWYRPEGGAVKVESDPLWTDAPEPLGEAVRTVTEMERAVLEGMPVGIVLRYGGFYGPGTWYAADGEIARRARGHQFPLIGGGEGVMSFIHVEDAAAAAVAALQAPASAVYNVSDNEPAPALVWMPVYTAWLGAPAPMRIPAMMARFVIGKPMTDWLTTMRGASNAKIAADLGWHPRHASWREGFAA